MPFFKKSGNDRKVADILSKISEQIKSNKNIYYRLNFLNTHIYMLYIKRKKID